MDVLSFQCYCKLKKDNFPLSKLLQVRDICWLSAVEVKYYTFSMKELSERNVYIVWSPAVPPTSSTVQFGWILFNYETKN